MIYLNQKAIKAKIHELGKQITKDGLEVLDRKIEDYLEKVCKQFNGHKVRIDAELIAITKF